MSHTLTTQIKPCDTELTVLVTYDHDEFGFCITSVAHNGNEVLDYLHINTLDDIEYLIKQQHKDEN